MKAVRETRTCFVDSPFATIRVRSRPPTGRAVCSDVSVPARMSDLQSRILAALEPSFHVDRELDGGGMARVFLATDTALSRRVVVKLLPPDAAAALSAERFQREISLAARLQHPHIVPLL